jgi:hypothetical protein
MDKIIDKIVALGIPGLILLVAIEIGGLAGGAALTVSLAGLGGPFGMLGGIVVLGLAGLISMAIAQYGFEGIFRGVIDGLARDGKSEHEILGRIERYPLSGDLKAKLRESVREEFARRRAAK